MIAAISSGIIDTAPPTAQPKHWLDGRYFVPLPDLSDEVRLAIYAGRAAAAWMELITRLRSLERRGPDGTRRAAVTGRIEGLGVNGLATALGCSHTTALKYLRHLESLSLIRTEQVAFTSETDPISGKIRRNYAKSPPKVFVVTIEDRHCRPCAAVKTRRVDTPETGGKAAGGTPETGGKVSNPPDRNWRHSIDRTSKEVRSYGPNKRRTAAGPKDRPAADAAANRGKPGQPDPAGDWQRQHDEQARVQAQKSWVDRLALGLGIPALEVAAQLRSNPRDLKKNAVAAGIMTPDGRWSGRMLCARNSTAPSPSRQDATLRASWAAADAAAPPSREQAGDELQESLDVLPADSRDRAAELGRAIEDDAAALNRLIEAKRLADATAKHVHGAATKEAARAAWHREKATESAA